MISIPRFVFQLFRSVGRRAGLHKRQSSCDSGLSITSDGQSCYLRAAAGDVAFEYRHVGTCDIQALTLPWMALDTLAGKGSEPVTLEAHGATVTTASWSNGGVPRQSRFDAPKRDKLKFPEPPQRFTANEPGLWRALRDAVPICDHESSRFALGCLHARGKIGRIDVTDGRHVLTQAGFQFPWEDDVLLPGSAVLGCRELDLNDSVGVGRTEKWIGFATGHWLVMVALQEGRFPRVDDIIPNPEAAKSRLEFSSGDAEFLGGVLPRLPNDDPQYDPITLDLNGQVLVRARETDNSRPTQVELTDSKLYGEPVMLNSNRCFLAHALRLGFRTLHAYGPEKPVLCCDDRRRYLWMLLNSESAITRHDNPITIAPRGSVSDKVSQRPSTQESSMSAPQTSAAPVATDSKGSEPQTRRRARRDNGSLIEQAVALRDVLWNAAKSANELIRAIKRQKRESKLIESTIAGLKQLQKAAG